MVVKKSHVLLQHFIDEPIFILTNLTTVVGNEHQQEEVPLMFEGVLVDFDDDFLMVASAEGAVDLVNREMVMRISQVTQEVETIPEGATLN